MTAPAPVEFNQAQHILDSYKRNAAEQYSQLLERISFLEAAVAQRDLVIAQLREDIAQSPAAKPPAKK